MQTLSFPVRQISSRRIREQWSSVVSPTHTSSPSLLPFCSLSSPPHHYSVQRLQLQWTQSSFVRHRPLHTQSRSFHIPSLSSLFSSSASATHSRNDSNNNSSNHNTNHHDNNSSRTLSATRILPLPPSALFEIIASVESYSSFLPFLTTSTVTARDPTSGYPTEAILAVGYGPVQETFTSRVHCDPGRWVVEARGGDRPTTRQGDGDAPNEDVFDYLSTRWELIPLPSSGERGGEGLQRTKVQLDIRFQFRNQFHAAVMSAIEDRVAGAMIEAFENRIRDMGEEIPG